MAMVKPLVRRLKIKLRVGLLTSDLSHGHGWAHYSLSLIRALRRAGAAVVVAAARNTPDGLDFPAECVLPAITPAERNLLLKQMMLVPRLQKLMRDCDVIHATAEPYALLAALIAGHRPLFVTGHGSYVRSVQRRKPPASTLYSWALRRGILVCVSHYTEKVAHESLPGVRTVVVNNGVDAGRFAAVRREENHPPTVLSVGAVKGRKGTLELVRAMARVRETIADVQCVIIGSLNTEPAYVSRVQAAIAELELADCVRLLGHVPESELLSWYGAADVFAVPAMNDGWKFEGFGLIHLEAGAAGLPVIGTRDCGAEDAIDHEKTGLLVSQSNVSEELPDAIMRLLRDPELVRRLGEAGRRKAEAQSWDKVAGQMMGLYQELT